MIENENIYSIEADFSMAYSSSSIEDWKCYLDAMNHKRYYHQGEFVPSKDVPTHILNKIESKEAKIITKTQNALYFSVLPKELREVLLYYLSDNMLKIICELDQFIDICTTTYFWKKFGGDVNIPKSVRKKVIMFLIRK